MVRVSTSRGAQLAHATPEQMGMAPKSLLHRNARGIEYEVGDPRRHQQPMQPEAVIAGLVATHDLRRRTQLEGRPCTDALSINASSPA
jgi:hypothetical protein